MTALPPEAEFRPPNGQPRYVTAVDFAWILAKTKGGGHRGSIWKLADEPRSLLPN